MVFRQVLIPRPREEALRLLRLAVEQSGLDPGEVKMTREGFVCSTGMSLTSWGCKISVEAGVQGPAATVVTIRVNPRLSIIDYGRSESELTEILNTLGGLMSSRV